MDKIGCFSVQKSHFHIKLLAGILEQPSLSQSPNYNKYKLTLYLSLDDTRGGAEY